MGFYLFIYFKEKDLVCKFSTVLLVRCELLLSGFELEFDCVSDVYYFSGPSRELRSSLD